MRKNRRFIGNILIIALVCVLNINVYASTKDVETRQEEFKLVNEDCAEIIVDNTIRGNILNRVTGRLSNNGNGSINVYGAVYGSVVCDKLVLEMTLQKQVNGSWQNVRSFSASANSKGFFTKSYNVSVAKGYYYRLKLVGVATKNGTTESQTGITDGLLIK
ncbi:MAG: hypothetical protein ACLRTF_11520 [Blautia sp.]